MCLLTSELINFYIVLKIHETKYEFRHTNDKWWLKQLRIFCLIGKKNVCIHLLVDAVYEKWWKNCIGNKNSKGSVTNHKRSLVCGSWQNWASLYFKWVSSLSFPREILLFLLLLIEISVSSFSLLYRNLIKMARQKT